MRITTLLLSTITLFTISFTQYNLNDIQVINTLLSKVESDYNDVSTEHMDEFVSLSNTLKFNLSRKVIAENEIQNQLDEIFQSINDPCVSLTYKNTKTAYMPIELIKTTDGVYIANSNEPNVLFGDKVTHINDQDITQHPLYNTRRFCEYITQKNYLNKYKLASIEAQTFTIVSKKTGLTHCHDLSWQPTPVDRYDTEKTYFWETQIPRQQPCYLKHVFDSAGEVGLANQSCCDLSFYTNSKTKVFVNKYYDKEQQKQYHYNAIGYVYIEDINDIDPTYDNFFYNLETEFNLMTTSTNRVILDINGRCDYASFAVVMKLVKIFGEANIMLPEAKIATRLFAENDIDNINKLYSRLTNDRLLTDDLTQEKIDDYCTFIRQEVASKYPISKPSHFLNIMELKSL